MSNDYGAPGPARGHSPLEPTPDRPSADTALRAHRGHIVKAATPAAPYAVVLTYDDGTTSVHPFATMRAGEAFIRGELPAPRQLFAPGRATPFMLGGGGPRGKDAEG